MKHQAVQLLTFGSILVVLVILMHSYFWLRLVRDPATSGFLKTSSVIFLVAMGVLVPLGVLGARILPYSASSIIAWFPYVWLGPLFIMLIFLFGADLSRAILIIIGKIAGIAKLAGVGNSVLLARIIAIAAVSIATMFGSIGLLYGLKMPVVRNVEVHLSKLPKQFDGFTITQISDTHTGDLLGKRRLQKIVDKVNALGSDMIAITGDLIDGKIEHVGDQATPVAELKAKHGVYFVTGNHECFSELPKWIAHLKELGLKVLENDRVEIKKDGASFVLAGVHDHVAGRISKGYTMDINKALSDIDKEEEIILLAHEPVDAPKAAKYDVGLILSGHTHAGQMWPFMYFIKMQHPYIAGLYNVEDSRTQVYVNQGTGTWGPPMRVGSENEITVITLRCGEKKTD